MKQAALICAGWLLILPTLRKRNYPPPSWTLAITRNSTKFFRHFREETIGLISGTSYTPLSHSVLGTLFAAVVTAMTILGVPLIAALILALLLCLTAVARSRQISTNRHRELRSIWPTFLEQLRSSMLSSQRALPYVMYDNSGGGFLFLTDLLNIGKREFETSGNFQSSLRQIWKYADDQTTSQVCASLINTKGATSSQIQHQLSDIAAALKTQQILISEAESKLAGVKIARLFVLLIPAGMALAGVAFAGTLSPFFTSTSLIQISVALLVIVMCWQLSNRLMQFPAIQNPAFEYRESKNEELR